LKAGLFGGTFNPVHNAHLILAEWICEYLGLNMIFMMPTAQPPHKTANTEIIDINHRINMLRIAISDNPLFKLAEFETDPSVTAYSIDTVRKFLNQYPEYDGNLFFVIGEDNFRLLSTWKEAEELSRLCKITVDRRSVDIQVDIPENMESPLFVDTPRIDISSTLVRDRIKDGKTVGYIIPKSVENYIKEHGLYK
jgi:nicotinate-nucleotide adenylyltransferase